MLDRSLIVAAGMTVGFAASQLMGAGVTVSVDVLPGAPPSTQIFMTGVTSHGDSAWGVGYFRSGADTRSLAYAWDGSGWASESTPSPASDAGVVNVTVQDVDTRDGLSVYAAGTYVASGAISPDTFLMSQNGSGWEHTVTPGQSSFGAQGFLFEAAHVDSDGVLWLGGQFQNPAAGRPTATIIKFDGGFSRFDGPLITVAAHRVRAIDSSGIGNIWAVGSAGGSSTAVGRVYALHNDGSGWSESSPPQTGFGEILRAVGVVSETEVWAGGSYQTMEGVQVVTHPLMWRWDGSSWERFECPLFPQDIVVTQQGEVYAVGGTALARWDAGAWVIVADLSSEGFDLAVLRSVTEYDASTLLAVGEAERGDTPIAAWFAIQQSCDPDFAEPFGQLDFSDISAFLTAFDAMAPEADLSEPLGQWDFSDVASFLKAFGAGCP